MKKKIKNDIIIVNIKIKVSKIRMENKDGKTK